MAKKTFTATLGARGNDALEIPVDLARAFKTSREAKTAFDGLSFTHRKEYVRWINEAKKEETRARRVTKTIEMLLAGTKHP